MLNRNIPKIKRIADPKICVHVRIRIRCARVHICVCRITSAIHKHPQNSGPNSQKDKRTEHCQENDQYRIGSLAFLLSCNDPRTLCLGFRHRHHDSRCRLFFRFEFYFVDRLPRDRRLDLANYRYLGRIILYRHLKTVAWHFDELRLFLVNQRRSVFHTEPENVFVVASVAGRAKFHRISVGSAARRRSRQMG